MKLFQLTAITVTLFVQCTERCTTWNKWFTFIRCLHSYFARNGVERERGLLIKLNQKACTLNKSAGGQIQLTPSPPLPPPTYCVWYVHLLMTFRIFFLHFYSLPVASAVGFWLVWLLVKSFLLLSLSATRWLYVDSNSFCLMYKNEHSHRINFAIHLQWRM